MSIYPCYHSLYLSLWEFAICSNRIRLCVYINVDVHVSLFHCFHCRITNSHIMLILNILLFLLGVSHALFSEMPCGDCTCYDGDGVVLAMCENAGLLALPVFEEYFGIRMSHIYLRYNNIMLLNTSVLTSWRSLNIIDLRANPIQCSELDKIPNHIQYYSDCLLDITTVSTTSYMSVATTTKIGGKFDQFVSQ
jgi:hypothetical protein